MKSGQPGLYCLQNTVNPAVWKYFLTKHIIWLLVLIEGILYTYFCKNTTCSWFIKYLQIGLKGVGDDYIQ
jgi:hypothetical protein